MIPLADFQKGSWDKPQHIRSQYVRSWVEKHADVLDHVQALVVKDKKVIAKEGRQGTKKMLSKLKKNSGGILIKFPKKRQDLRMDLPTIGLQTLKDCKKYGLKGIVMKSKKNILLDKIKCIKFANKNKIFINII